MLWQLFSQLLWPQIVKICKDTEIVELSTTVFKNWQERVKRHTNYWTDIYLLSSVKEQWKNNKLSRAKNN